MSNVRFYIESSIITKTEINPSFKGVFSHKRKDKKAYYEVLCRSIMICKGVDYEVIMQHQGEDCLEIKLTVETACAEGYELYWAGKFKFFDITRDDPCYLSFTPKPDTAYQCLSEVEKEEIELYKLGEHVVVRGQVGTYEQAECISEEYEWTSTNNASRPNENNIPPEQIPNNCIEGEAGVDWFLEELVVTHLDAYEVFNTNPSTGLLQKHFVVKYVVTARYGRSFLELPCLAGDVPAVPPTDTTWTLYEDNCVAQGYSKFIANYENKLGAYWDGRPLAGWLTQYTDSVECLTGIKSNFFNINAVGDSPENIAYEFAEEFLHNLTVHQKSDIKRKNAGNPSRAAAWAVTPEEIEHDLRVLFNVYATIDDAGVLVLEHISYYEAALGWDVSDKAISTKVDNSGTGNIKQQTFYFADKESSARFAAQTIKYNCGENTDNPQCKLFSTDLLFIENENNDEAIADTGFVLVSTFEYDGERIIKDENTPLSWDVLLENLHLHHRPYRSGELNGVQQEFLSWQPYVKAEAFKLDYCCGDIFKAEDKITTKIGEGIVDEAEHNVYTNKIKVSNLY